jgi:radical SAM superfamily enzyme YgiQ (UPF0313 family)
MYKTKKFRVREFEDIKADVREMAKAYPKTTRIFLADGDALAADTEFLIKVLDLINDKFPYLERMSVYAGPSNLLAKSVDELREFKKRKLDILYLGIETGNDELLKKIKKGATSAEIIEGSKKAIDAGLRMSTIILLGLGGVEGSFSHAKDSAKVVNAIDPQFLACLTLMLGQFTEVYENKIMGGNFKSINKQQSLQELRWFVEDINLKDCMFSTQHASNYLPIGGHFPEDKERILKLIDGALNEKVKLRSEWMRGL